MFKKNNITVFAYWKMPYFPHQPAVRIRMVPFCNTPI